MSTTKKFTLQQLLDWCKRKTEADHELTIKWDGGGDSGWVYFEIDGEKTSEPEAEDLVDMMYEQLDYGSWAGEFSANGEATYDIEKQAFIGTDYYSESEETSCDSNIEIRIPKNIPFTMLNIRTEDENVNVQCQLFISNGFVHPSYAEIQDKLDEQLQEEIGKAIDADLEKTGEEIDSAWHSYQILREQFKVDGDDLVYVLDSVFYTFHETTERDMIIDLAELLKEEEEENGL